MRGRQGALLAAAAVALLASAGQAIAQPDHLGQRPQRSGGGQPAMLARERRKAQWKSETRGRRR